MRAALIVALTIPFALLFASIWLDLTQDPGEPAVARRARLRHGRGRRRRHGREHRAAHQPPQSGDTTNADAVIRDACHEVQRPVFYAIAIIITAYLPIFTLQRIEGRLFRPMAWTVAFALLGAMTFSILVAPVLASAVLPQGRQARRATRSWTWLTEPLPAARCAGRSSIAWVTVGVGARRRWRCRCISAFSGVIGSEFLPHLDEGSIWARGTLAVSTSLTEGTRFMNQARLVFASFPEVDEGRLRRSDGPTTAPIRAGSATPSTSST